MNWLVALPEFALGLAAMAVLARGCLRTRPKPRSFSPACCRSVAFCITAGLVLDRAAGPRLMAGCSSPTPSAASSQVLILAGAALAIILSLDYNRQEDGTRPFRVPGADPLRHHRHDDHGGCHQPHDPLSGAGAAIAGALRDRRLCTRHACVLSEAGLKYFVLGSLASGLLLYGISLTYGFSGLHGFRPRREGAAFGNGHRSGSSSAWCSCSRALSSRWRPCPSTCGRRMSMRVRRLRSPRCSAPPPRSPRWRCSCG